MEQEEKRDQDRRDHPQEERERDEKEKREEEDTITRLEYRGREFILIGTAHVSKKSAQQVKEVIEREEPDSVCVELDQQRYQTIISGKKWKETDIFKIIKEKKATLLLMNLIISSFQQRLAKQFGIKPGQEMIQAINSAREMRAELILADRNIQITFKRVWHNIGFIGKLKLMVQIIMSLLLSEEITEEELEELKSKDMLSAILQEFTDSFPKLKKPLLDERDQYLAQKIKEAPGEKIVAVLGAAHVPGITEQIHQDHDLRALAEVPTKSRWPRLLPWLIPALIIGIIAYSFFISKDAGIQQSLSWILYNGSLSAIGAALAFSHPLTILAAFLAAPLSSINPFLAAGWIAGIVEAFLRRPRVEHFEALSHDLTSFKGFWKNRVTHILLVIALTNVGSSLGTFIGGANVVRRFLELVSG